MPHTTDQTSDTASLPSVARVSWSTWGQAAIVVLGAFATMLSATLVNAGLPAMARDLQASHALVQWVATGYLLALATGVPVSGWAARRLGLTRLWLIGMVMFTAASLLCAEAGTISILIAGRVLQGLAGGLLVPAGQAIVGRIAGRARLGRVMSTLGIAIVVAPALGTTLGSLLLQQADWAWLFWINVALGSATLVVGIRWLPALDTGAADRLDGFGLALVVIGLPLLLYGVTLLGQSHHPNEALGLTVACSGAGLLTGFVFWTLHAKALLLQLRLLANRVFAAGAAVMFFGGAINFGAQIIFKRDPK